MVDFGLGKIFAAVAFEADILVAEKFILLRPHRLRNIISVGIQYVLVGGPGAAGLAFRQVGCGGVGEVQGHYIFSGLAIAARL